MSQTSQMGEKLANLARLILANQMAPHQGFISQSERPTSELARVSMILDLISLSYSTAVKTAVESLNEQY